LAYVKGLEYPFCIPFNLISFFADKKKDVHAGHPTHLIHYRLDQGQQSQTTIKN